MLVDLVTIPNEKSETIVNEICKIMNDRKCMKKIIGYGAAI